MPSRSPRTYDVDPGRERNGDGRHSIAGVRQSSSDLFCAESAGRMPRTQHHRGVQQRRLRLNDGPQRPQSKSADRHCPTEAMRGGGMAPHQAARPQGRLTNAPGDVKLPRDESAARVRVGNPPEPRPTRCGHPNRVSLDSPTMCYTYPPPSVTCPPFSPCNSPTTPIPSSPSVDPLVFSIHTHPRIRPICPPRSKSPRSSSTRSPRVRRSSSRRYPPPTALLHKLHLANLLPSPRLPTSLKMSVCLPSESSRPRCPRTTPSVSSTTTPE